MPKYNIDGLVVTNPETDDVVDFGRIFNQDGSIKTNPYHQNLDDFPEFADVERDFFKEGGALVKFDMVEQLITTNNFGPFTDVVQYYYARSAYFLGAFSVAIFWR